MTNEIGLKISNIEQGMMNRRRSSAIANFDLKT